MKIRFIFHSAWLVEHPEGYFLFDYYHGELPPLDKDKPLYILASHQHYDHFSPVIFQLMKRYPKSVYILSDDISADLVAEATKEMEEAPRLFFVHPGSRLELGKKVRVDALPSTDIGVSYLVSFGEEAVFHAGDLNDWHWSNVPRSKNEEMQAEYLSALEELKKLLFADRPVRLTAAFIAMDPVLGEGCFQGPAELLEQVPAEHVFPMHMWERYSIGRDFLNIFPEYRERFHPIRGEGEEFCL